MSGSEEARRERLEVGTRLHFNAAAPAAFPRKGSFRAALDGYSMVWPIVIVATLIGSFIGDTGSGLDNPVSLFLITEKDISGRVLLVLSAVILAPIFEEPVFRGLFYRRLRVILSPYGAAAASGFIFAAAHFLVSDSSLWPLASPLDLHTSIPEA